PDPHSFPTRRSSDLPIVYLAWHVPSQRSNDAPALEVLSTILAGGRASRLYRDLVYQRQLALEAGGDYSYFAIDPNLFWFWATPIDRKSTRLNSSHEW